MYLVEQTSDNITVAQDLTVDTDLLFVDVSRQIGITSQPVDTDGALNIYDSGLNALNLRVTTNESDQGISFQNGNSYTWNIVRKENVDVVNTAHLVFRGNEAGPQAVLTDLTDYLTLYAGGNVEFGVGDTGIVAPDSDYKLKVAGEIYADTSLTIRDASNNNGAPIYFLGATGALVGGGPDQLSNFRVGNSLISGDIFEITSNDGSVGATDLEVNSTLLVKGTNNQVAINTTAFGGQDQSDPQNIIDETILNVPKLT